MAPKSKAPPIIFTDDGWIFTAEENVSVAAPQRENRRRLCWHRRRALVEHGRSRGLSV